ncbi:MAG TPA: c-type cytochrome [Bryobacteraceae bacterium]|nr:c-type cytochrome [Bryobacteraceae bacterium]
MGQRTTVAIALGLAIGLAGSSTHAQNRPASNPRDGDPAAIREGLSIFRARCADCHGLDAKGVRGPDLTRLWESGASEARLFQTIRSGVPGSEMPAAVASDDDIWAVLAYLHTLNATAGTEPLAGNADSGAKIFQAKCAGCHRVHGYGGVLGPDLSLIASRRSRTALARKIRNASSYVAAGYEPVTLVTRDGRRIRGAKKNEDAFSIQIMDTRERIQGYPRAALREVIAEKRSLMPDFVPDTLSDRDLDDLLAYLGTLRAPAVTRR